MLRKINCLILVLSFVLISCKRTNYPNTDNDDNILLRYEKQIEKDIVAEILRHNIVKNAEIFYFDGDDDDYFFRDVKVLLKNGDIILFSNVSKNLKFENKAGGILKINNVSFETKSIFYWDPNAMHVKELSVLLNRDITTVLDVLDNYTEICKIADTFAISDRWLRFNKNANIKKNNTRGGYYKKGLKRFELLKVPSPDFFIRNENDPKQKELQQKYLQKEQKE